MRTPNYSNSFGSLLKWDKQLCPQAKLVKASSSGLDFQVRRTRRIFLGLMVFVFLEHKFENTSPKIRKGMFFGGKKC